MPEQPAATDPDNRPETADFGFREVAEDLKSGMVHDVFAAVAGRYDIMNDVMSGGVHRLWKQAMVAWLKPQPHETIVDLAGGTGDIAFRMAQAGRQRLSQKQPANLHPDAGRILVADINAEMVAVGRKRAQKDTDIGWLVSDAEKLPLPDRMADAVTIAFGIRNCTHIDRVLSEAYRILKPGGRFATLEFSKMQVVGLSRLYDLYSFQLVPRIGAAIAQNRDAYRYLVESIRRFPDQDHYATMLREAGFGSVKVRNFSGGIAALHTGWKI